MPKTYALGAQPGHRAREDEIGRDAHADLGRVQAAREAIGPDVGLGLECHGRYDVESAIQMAKAVEPYRPMWLEEPVPSDNPDAMAAVERIEGWRALGDNIIETIINKNVVRELVPLLQEAGAEGIIEYPLNKLI